jgi:error-prone DNA polymerase
LRQDLRQRRIISCAEAMQMRDGRWVDTAGLVLVRQMPGSAKGVMFVTVEDGTGFANLIVWPELFEKQRRIVLSASMMAVNGRIQREGDVIHLIAWHLTDLTGDLNSVGDRDTPFPLPHGRGDELHSGSPEHDARTVAPRNLQTRDIYIPDRHVDTTKLKGRNFH